MPACSAMATTRVSGSGAAAEGATLGTADGSRVQDPGVTAARAASDATAVALTWAGIPSPEALTICRKFCPQKPDHGIPVTARKTMIVQAKAPVTACRSRHQ